jgi:hypothetical protein
VLQVLGPFIFPVYLYPLEFHGRMQASSGQGQHLPHIRGLLPRPAGSWGLELHHPCRHLCCAPRARLLLGAVQPGTPGLPVCSWYNVDIDLAGRGLMPLDSFLGQIWCSRVVLQAAGQTGSLWHLFVQPDTAQLCVMSW